MYTLKDLRNISGLKQDELAEMFGVSTRTIQNMEKDSSNIKDNLVQKYLAAFDISYDDIFLGNKYEKNVFYKNKRKAIIYNLDQKENV